MHTHQLCLSKSVIQSFCFQAYESQHTLVDRRLELDTLGLDNNQSLEQLLKSHYPGYFAVMESGRGFDKVGTACDDSSGMEDCEEDSSSSGGSDIDLSDVMSSDDEDDEFSLETAEQV